MPPDPRLASALLAESSWLHRLALRLVAEPERAADAAQETLARALERPPAAATPLRRWLAAVLRNALRQEHRGAARRIDREREHDLARPILLDGEPADELASRLELHARLATAVRSLDEPYRTTIALRYLEELPVRTVAERTGVPEKTVYTRLDRAVVLLRDRLDREHGSRSAWAQLLLPLLHAPPTPTTLTPTPLALGTTLAPVLAMGTLWKWTGACAAVAGLGLLAVRTLTPVERRSPPAEPSHAAAAPADLTPAPVPLEPTPALAAERSAITAESSAPASPAPAAAPTAAPAPTLVGYVLDLDRRPMAGLEVVYERVAPTPDHPLAHEPIPGVATSASDGRFELPDSGGPCRILARGLGYATVIAPVLAGHALPPEPPVVFVGPERRYAGRVVDAAGVPIADAEVDLDLDDALVTALVPGTFGSVLPLARTTADGHGRFALPPVGAAPGTRIDARAEGYAAHGEPLPEASSDDIVLVLEREAPLARTLAGRVQHADGRPAAGAYVATGGAATRAAEDGTFALDLEEGDERAVVRAGQAGALPAELTLDGLAPAELQDLVLVLGGPPLALRGRVLDRERNPIPGARVWTDDGVPFGTVSTRLGELEFMLNYDLEGMLAEPSGGDQAGGRRARADDAGRFELTNLLPRRYALWALDPRTHDLVGPIDAPAGADAIELVLPGEPARRVAGVVTKFSGDPVAGAKIAVARLRRGPDGSPRAHRGADDVLVETDAEGRFEFPALCAEGTRLVIGSSDAPNEMTFDLDDQPDVEDLHFRLASTCYVRVRFDDLERADSVALHDERDEPLMVGFQIGGVICMSYGVQVKDGVSDLLTTDERASTLVLSKGGAVTERIPLRLVPGEVNEIEP